jgi:hypothetical protein
MKISILEIKNDVIWLVFCDDDDRMIYKQPLAQALRDHLKPERCIDKKRGDGWNTEQAFRKLKLSTYLTAELTRA